MPLFIIVLITLIIWYISWKLIVFSLFSSVWSVRVMIDFIVWIVCIIMIDITLTSNKLLLLLLSLFLYLNLSSIIYWLIFKISIKIVNMIHLINTRIHTLAVTRTFACEAVVVHRMNMIKSINGVCIAAFDTCYIWWKIRKFSRKLIWFIKSMSIDWI